MSARHRCPFDPDVASIDPHSGPRRRVGRVQYRDGLVSQERLPGAVILARMHRPAKPRGEYPAALAPEVFRLLAIDVLVGDLGATLGAEEVEELPHGRVLT
jgi:hypothetical protein